MRMPSLARGILRLAYLGLVGGFLLDRFLRWRSAGSDPVPIRSLVVIDAPIDRVWDVVADIDGQPRWMPDLTSVRLVTPGPVRVGTRAVGSVRILGITTADPVTVTAFDRPSRFAIRHEGAFTGHGTITLGAGADGTTTIVRWEETLVAPFLAHAVGLLLRPILAGIFQADLFRLRDLVEARAGGAAGERTTTRRLSSAGPNGLDQGSTGASSLDDLTANASV